MLALRWRDVTRTRLHVRHTKDSTGAVHEPKTGEVRSLPLDPAVVPYLVSLPHGEPDDPVFPQLTMKRAQKELRASTDAYREKSWRIVEANIAPQPWFLGTRFSALDVYVKVMSHWRPRRDWFKANCPKLMSVALAADKEPRLAKVWQRNFP